MKTPCSLQGVRAYAALVGAMDLATGLALMTVPAWTLARMGAAVPGAEALGYVRFSGAFVAAVGASYLLALARPLVPLWATRAPRKCNLIGYTFGVAATGGDGDGEKRAVARGGVARLRGALEFTLVARAAAGGFAAVAVFTGLFEPAWLAVAATDLGCGAAQAWMLQRGIAGDE
jgi:hypothetical protein